MSLFIHQKIYALKQTRLLRHILVYIMTEIHVYLMLLSSSNRRYGHLNNVFVWVLHKQHKLCVLQHFHRTMDDSEYGLNQWETNLYCNVVSYWLFLIFGTEWIICFVYDILNIFSFQLVLKIWWNHVIFRVYQTCIPYFASNTDIYHCFGAKILRSHYISIDDFCCQWLGQIIVSYSGIMVNGCNLFHYSELSYVSTIASKISETWIVSKSAFMPSIKKPSNICDR